MGRVIVVTAPAVEPVSVEEAKLHLRVDIADDNALIAGLIAGARDYAEQYMGRALVTQTLELVLDSAPGRCVRLPRPPLQSVTSIKFVDKAGAETTVDPGDYLVESTETPGFVMLRSGASWPAVDLREAGGVRIRYVAGYGGAAAVPPLIAAAIKLYVGTLYENREDVLVAQGVTVMNLPFGAESLLGLYRVGWRF